MSRPEQIRCIKTLARQAGLEDADYRQLVLHHGGAASSTAIDEAGADRVIAALRRLPGADRPPAARRAAGRFAPKLQSLWISAYNLGLVRDRSDRALHAWLRNRLKVDHTRFLADAAEAARAIEGLKAWIARDGDVAWPRNPLPGDGSEARAVVQAIAARLLAKGDEAGLNPAAHGAAAGRLPRRVADYSTTELQALANLLGTRLRARLTAKAKPRRAA